MLPSLLVKVLDAVNVLIGGTIVAKHRCFCSILNQWHHIAVTRLGANVRLFIDGAQEDNQVATTDLGSSAPLTVGADYATANGVQAYIDETSHHQGCC